MSNILDASWISEQELKKAISSVSSFEPSVLITTKDQFNGYINAFAIWHMDAGIGIWLKNVLLKLGIKKIIWAEYMPKNQFELTSEKSYQNLISKYKVDVINLEK